MDAKEQYRWITDESEDASGDNITFADESEYIGDDDDDDAEAEGFEPSAV